MTDIETLKARQSELAERVERQEIESNIRLLELATGEIDPMSMDYPHALMEATAGQTAGWGLPIPRNEYPDFGEPGFRRGFYHTTRVEDRQDGRWMPVYETEDDVTRIRAMGRYLAPSTSVAVGAVESLYNYVFGEGFEFTVAESTKAPQDLPAGLIERFQDFVDTFLESNDIVGIADRDHNTGSREDGERFIVLHSDRQSIRTETIEPEQVTEPKEKRQLDDWQAEEFGITGETSWTFGVHTPKRDTERPYGYHVVYDGAGTDWDYVPSERMVHIKRNVPPKAKRGISDFYPIARDLLGDEKLTRNLGTAAAAIAAIVGVRKFASGTLKTDVNSLLTDKGGSTVTRYNRSGDSRSVTQEPHDGGTILNSGGYDWVNGPLGSGENSNLLLVAQHIRRSIGVRWTMPEYLVSGDASNANYASTSVAAESWVRSRQADQRFFGRHHVSMLWKAARMAFDLGWFNAFDIGWNQLRRWLEINAGYPEVTTQDFAATAASNSQMIADGYKSKRTAATEQGLDFDAETENIGTEPRPVDPSATGADPTVMAAFEAIRESCDSVEEERSLLRDIAETVRG